MLEENNPEADEWERQHWHEWPSGINLVLMRAVAEIGYKTRGIPRGFDRFDLLRSRLRKYVGDLATQNNYAQVIGDDLYEAFISTVTRDRNIAPKEILPELEQITVNAEQIEHLPEEKTREMRRFLLSLLDKHMQIEKRRESYITPWSQYPPLSVN